MKDVSVDMSFCRRCGSKLSSQGKYAYRCTQGHEIFQNAAPAVGVVLYNDRNEVVMLERAVDPGKGRLDIPGGFCDGPETVEAAIARELQEETGLTPDQYGPLEYICSGIDPYEYKGEVLSVLGVMFRARLNEGAQPVASDDAAAVAFIPLATMDMSSVYFPAVRGALERLRRQ